MLCAVELAPESSAVPKAAGLLAQAYGARICLLTIGPSIDEQSGLPFAQSVRHAFEKASNAGGLEIGVDTARVLDADIPEGIRRAAMEEQADLVLSRMWPVYLACNSSIYFARL